MSKIFVWRYTLRSKGRLNSATSRQEHDGALIRVGEGFGCIHPWPELGDVDVDEQLSMLKAGKSTPVLQQALRCAEIDGAARAAGESLFNAPVPQSHWIVMPGDDPAVAREMGFKIAKIKIGPNLSEVTRQIMIWSAGGFRLRLDANESLSLATFFDFWASLKEVRDLVEWVEDPTPWSRGQWTVLQEAAIPLAVDRDLETRFESGYTAVVKPALSSWLPPSEETFFVTSYMDHALGQSWASSEAARIASGPKGQNMREGGLLTHRCFEPDEFFERFEVKDCRLQSPGGTGLGFDDILEALPWKLLS